MGGRRLALASAFAIAAWPAPSPAVVDTIVITHVGGAQANATDYLPGTDALGIPALLPAGQTLQYRNMNTGLPHDLVSSLCVSASDSYEDERAGGSCQSGYRRLFGSDIAGYNQQRPVEGTNLLAPGEYRFFCSVHGSISAGQRAPMAGSLLVIG